VITGSLLEIPFSKVAPSKYTLSYRKAVSSILKLILSDLRLSSKELAMTSLTSVKYSAKKIAIPDRWFQLPTATLLKPLQSAANMKVNKACMSGMKSVLVSLFICSVKHNKGNSKLTKGGCNLIATSCASSLTRKGVKGARNNFTHELPCMDTIIVCGIADASLQISSRSSIGSFFKEVLRVLG